MLRNQGLEFYLGNIQLEQFLLVSQSGLGGGALNIEQINKAEAALLKTGLNQSQCGARLG